MNFDFTSDQELLRRSVREFAESELRPHVREWDEAQQFPRELLVKLADLGLMGIQFPEEFGGAALSPVDYCICIEELARVDPSVSLTVAAHNGLGAAHIAMFGTDEQKRRYLIPLARGEMLAAWGLTEASSGSDAGAMRTSATRDGDCWVINGTKQFITHGRTGDLIVGMAVTNKTKGSRGITAFIVERGTPGFRAGKKEDKLGMRASETSEVIFENCRVPASQVLGQEGQGFINALQVLDAGRIGIAALAVGLAEGAYEAARPYPVQSPPIRSADRNVQSIRASWVKTHPHPGGRLLTYRGVPENGGVPPAGAGGQAYSRNAGADQDGPNPGLDWKIPAKNSRELTPRGAAIAPPRQ